MSRAPSPASSVSRKSSRVASSSGLAARDFEAQAAVRDVHTNTRLIAAAARSVGAAINRFRNQ